ncbi:hypothetical protein CRG98_002996 [Punica granatum]|uniref:Uncharacterized protein n=1 Tax=Punica granatum TaxID=22663 RepID=A0A2I0L7L3_PUNGR|nr:hypothetical protein CRG98_002996 [Punica granatum]
MSSQKGLRWRKPALKPILTSQANKQVVNVVDEEGEEPLSPSARLFHEPNFNVYIIAIMGCKNRIYPDLIRANLGHTLLRHPRFSSLQVEDRNGKLKWARTEVDLEKHVIVPEPEPNSIEFPDEWVEDYISNLSKTTIDRSQQPLWDLHLLNIKTSDAEATVVLRIHHSLGDGSSLMSLLLACTRQISNPDALPTIPSKKKNQLSLCGSGAGRIQRWIVRLWWFTVLIWNTVVDVFKFAVTAVFLMDTETPLKASPGVELRPRRFVYRTISLDDIKLIKNAMNATVNDVALGITQAGLSRYLNCKYEVENNLPKNIRLRSTLLMNLRPAAGIQALANMMEKNTEAKWGNWIGYVLLPIDIALHQNPLEYVRRAKTTVDRKKHSLEAIYTFSIAEVVLKLFGIKRASALSRRVIMHTTMCFSNLVGPVEEIGFYGHPMTFLAPGCYGQPHGLMINFQSYVNKMTFVVSADEDTIPDPHQLCQDIVKSLELIRDAVKEPRARQT